MPQRADSTGAADDLGPSSVQLRRRLATIIVLVAILAVVASSDATHAQLMRLVDALQRLMALHPVFGGALFVAASAISAILAFFSSTVLVPSAVALYGRAVTVVLLWLGWMLGGFLSYTLARRFGPSMLRKLASPELLHRLTKRITPATPWSLVLLLQVALPSELPGSLLGLVGYPRARYLAALAIAELPFAIGVVVAGESVVSRRISVLAGISLLGFVVGALALRVLRRKLSSAD